MSRTVLAFGDDTRTYFGNECTIKELPRIKGLPISRKARSPEAWRVEMVALIVLVIVLSTVIFVGVRNVAQRSLVASCVANSSVVVQGIDDLRAENTASPPTTSTAWRQALLPGSGFVGAPFLKSWPHSDSYVISIAGAGAIHDSGDAIVPRSGDVLVTILGAAKTFDATAHADAACASV